jgi:hypothetical protein
MDYHTSFIFTKPKYNKWPARFFRGKAKEFSHEDSFYYFLKNSQIELLTDSSSFGFVYKCTFQKQPQKSPYFYLNDKKESIDVTVIVLKCLLMNDRTIDDIDDDHYWQYKKICGKRSKRHFDMKNRFMEEVRMQTEISKLGVVAMNRNAPVVLFSKIYEPTDHYSITTLIKNRMLNEPRNRPFEQLCDEYYFKCKIPLEPGMNYYFGIIAMEYIKPRYTLFNNIIKPIIVDDILLRHGCEHIHKYNSTRLSEKSDRLRWAYNTGRYEIIRMAIDTGYTEGDYHTDNLLMDEHGRKAILIDFGKAKKIANASELIILWRQQKNIKRILEYIFHSTFEDNERGDEFKWVKNVDTKDIEIILYIHRHREALVEKRSSIALLELMDEKTTFQ